MLVLTRRLTESIQIGANIRIRVLRIGPSSVRIGIEAPADLTILRDELLSFPDTDTVTDTEGGEDAA